MPVSRFLSVLIAMGVGSLNCLALFLAHTFVTEHQFSSNSFADDSSLFVELTEANDTDRNLLNDSATPTSSSTEQPSTDTSPGSKSKAETDGGATGQSQGGSAGGATLPKSGGGSQNSHLCKTYSIPADACKTLEAIKKDPSKNNHLIIGAAKTAISSLPKGSTLLYDGRTWYLAGDFIGSIRVTAKTSSGSYPFYATLEKKSSTWYVIDIRPPSQ